MFVTVIVQRYYSGNAQILPPKAGFFLSALVLAFLYGFGTRAGRLPLNLFLECVWNQVRSVLEQHTFLMPRVYDRSGARVVEPDAVQPGVTLLTSVWNGPNGWSPRIRLIEREGQTLHEWRINEAALFGDALGLQPKQYLHGTTSCRAGA